MFHHADEEADRRPWPGRMALTGAIALSVLLAVFAFDAIILTPGFAVHLLPAAAVLAGGLLGARWPAVGFVWFLVIALLSVPFAGDAVPPRSMALVTGPLLLLAALHAAGLARRRAGLRAHAR